MNFDYLLVDIWHDENKTMEGLKLISAFQHKIEEKVRKRVLTFKREKEEDIKLQHKIKERVEKEVPSHNGKITNKKELISKLQNGMEEEFTFHNGGKQKKEDKSVVPEILAYTILDDVETIQMAQRMGATGYVPHIFLRDRYQVLLFPPSHKVDYLRSSIFLLAVQFY